MVVIEGTLNSKIPLSNIKTFQAKLLTWYLTHGRTFPWREKGISHFDIIIAEVLLQRTKAETIAKFYKNFIIKYPDWLSISEAPTEFIEQDLKPIGLYKQRAKRIKDLAVELNNRNGIVPKKRKDIDTIPMFGQYIANAVELQVFNRKKPLLDVNMARVLERYFGPRLLSDIRYDPYLQILSHKIVNHQNSKEINWAVLDFAQLICKSRKPLCENCILSENCKYYITLKNK